MFVRDGRVFHSASDLKAAVECEWGLMRRLDAKLGRVAAAADEPDSMLERAARLGDQHEQRTLDAYIAELGEWAGGDRGVASIERPESQPEALAAARDASLTALRAGAEVVFQATFYDEASGFVGFADFLKREGDAYAVYDTKLARRAKVTALLQLAAYAAQLQRDGIPVHDRVHLILGTGEVSSHRLADIQPVYNLRVARLQQLVRDRLADDTAIVWGAEGVAACGRCAECAVQIEATRDVLLVAGMRGAQRSRLAAVGIRTIDEFAASTGSVPGIGDDALRTLRDQAVMQGAAPATGVAYAIHHAIGLGALPPPSSGDIFFDFEGDPLWTDDDREWGLDYLFGLVVIEGGEPQFLPFWAHDRAGERQALIDFLAYVGERRRRYPDLQIYHYADYERSHLQMLCARYGVGEAQLDVLLREHVLVDLYPIVRRSVRISERSYSLKKLEPLYMGSELRASEVTTGAASIDAYVAFSEHRARGEHAEADRILLEIADYNRYDCLSTLRLRDWLLARADEQGVPRRPPLPVPTEAEQRLERREDAVRERLLAAIASVPAGERTPDQEAIALAAAAIEYHRREDKSYWWEHFNRHVAPIDTWAEQRGVLVVEHAEVEEDWHRPDGARSTRRILRLRGTLAVGSRLGVGDQPWLMYEPPVPEGIEGVPAGQRGEHARTEVLEVAEDAEHATVRIAERLGSHDAERWHALPVALTPGSPIPTRAQRAAILEWGERLADALPDLPPDPSLDLLRRLPPRGGVIDRGSPVATIIATLEAMEGSALAVQGPPGSGKTHVGASVVADLVARGWRVGVVAQSHEVVENLLRRVLSRGVDAQRVAKKAPSSGYETAPPWRVLTGADTMDGFLAEPGGRVLGGTAWDFANASKVPRGALDVLVVDEAGQYSLANTIAVGVSAKRLLLLGDPQQLPQVSQGLHPEPIDSSALGWLSDGHDVLPADLGVFLAESWRMHPALCAAVSALSYEGRLRAREPETRERRLEGVEPGVHAVPVQHSGNAVESPEEAVRVVDLVRSHVGRRWLDPHAGRDDALTPADIIVVAPYNAQVACLRAALDAAGFVETPVGTVDKFQGQEAAVAIVSLTASSAADAPRGIHFVLQRNRLNVAVSRAQWAAYIVHSPALADALPTTPERLAELAGFLTLTG